MAFLLAMWRKMQRCARLAGVWVLVASQAARQTAGAYARRATARLKIARQETRRYARPVGAWIKERPEKGGRLTPKTVAVAAAGVLLMSAALGSPSGTCYPTGAGQATAATAVRSEDVILMARVIEGEAADEPYQGKVAVGAVILNRAEHPDFPKSIRGVIYEQDAFEAVSNGQMWRPLSQKSIRAAKDALRGNDPTGGALYYWNPYKPVNPWVWSRPVHRQIGNHVFAY